MTTSTLSLPTPDGPMPAYEAVPDGRSEGRRRRDPGGVRGHTPHRVDLPAPGRRRLPRRRAGAVPPVRVTGARLHRLRQGHAHHEGARRRQDPGRRRGGVRPPRRAGPGGHPHRHRRVLHGRHGGSRRRASTGRSVRPSPSTAAGSPRAGSGSTPASTSPHGCRAPGSACSATSTRASRSTTSRRCGRRRPPRRSTPRSCATPRPATASTATTATPTTRRRPPMPGPAPWPGSTSTWPDVRLASRVRNGEGGLRMAGFVARSPRTHHPKRRHT